MIAQCKIDMTLIVTNKQHHLLSSCSDSFSHLSLSFSKGVDIIIKVGGGGRGGLVILVHKVHIQFLYTL